MSDLEKIIEARKDNSKANRHRSRLAGEEMRVGLCSQINSVFQPELHAMGSSLCPGTSEFQTTMNHL